MAQALQRLLVFSIVLGAITAGAYLFNRHPADQPTHASKARTTNPNADGEADSHNRMIAELKRIHQQSLVDDPYFQTETLRNERAELDATPVGDTQRRFELNLFQSQDYRRLGQDKMAVSHLLAAEEILAKSNLQMTPQQLEIVNYEMGVTYLRKGETENCLHCQTGESCILPISGGGIHEQQIGSRKAMEYFKRVLKDNPQHLKARWLLNLAAMTIGEFPDGIDQTFRLPVERFQIDDRFPRFHDVARAVGLRTVNCGGGVVAEDFDNDGYIDILTSTWDPGGQIHYFRNAGDGSFVDETQKIGLTGILGGINAVQADYNNDGLIDVFVVRGAWLDQNGRHPNSLLQNTGVGFRDVTFDVGLTDEMYPSSNAAWQDFDLDGDLDLFVGNEGAPCQLFRNDGDQGFVDIAATAGVMNKSSTKGSTWGDFNNDRHPDLYVSNLEGANRLYQNNADGTFTDVAEQLSVDKPVKSFPTWFWDVNNDGALDLFVASYDVGIDKIADDYLNRKKSAPDRLYLGDGNGGFEDVGQRFGLTRTTQPMGCNFGDLDNDGFPDFSLGTGYPDLDAVMPNLMFRNQNGKSFDDISISGGFAHLQKGHGTAFVDLDNDGDQDVFMQMGGAYPADAFGNVLYENPGFGNQWLRVKLTGVQSNRYGIGARVKIVVDENGSSRTIYKHVNSGGSFGASSLTIQLGLGKADRIESLEVYWPVTDKRQVFQQIKMNRLIEITEGSSRPTVSEIKRFEFRS